MNDDSLQRAYLHAWTSLGITHTHSTPSHVPHALQAPAVSTTIYRTVHMHTLALLTLLPLAAKTCVSPILCFARHDRFTNTRTICDDLPRAADSDRTARCSSSLTGIIGTVACRVYSSPCSQYILADNILNIFHTEGGHTGRRVAHWEGSHEGRHELCRINTCAAKKESSTNKKPARRARARTPIGQGGGGCRQGW